MAELECQSGGPAGNSEPVVQWRPNKACHGSLDKPCQAPVSKKSSLEISVCIATCLVKKARNLLSPPPVCLSDNVVWREDAREAQLNSSGNLPGDHSSAYPALGRHSMQQQPAVAPQPVRAAV